MYNINFLSKILSTDHEYWIVAKKNEIREYGDWKRVNDSIMFISIPYDIDRNVERDEIKLTQLEKLKNAKLDCNIFLNEPYAPFQIGQSFYNIFDGHPVERNQKQLLVKALELESDNLWDYKKLIDEVCKEEPN